MFEYHLNMGIFIIIIFISASLDSSAGMFGNLFSSEEIDRLKVENEKLKKDNQQLESYFQKNKSSVIGYSEVSKNLEACEFQKSFYERKISDTEEIIEKNFDQPKTRWFNDFKIEAKLGNLLIDYCANDEKQISERPKNLFIISTAGLVEASFVAQINNKEKFCGSEENYDLWRFTFKPTTLPRHSIIIDHKDAKYSSITFEKLELSKDKVRDFNLIFDKINSSAEHLKEDTLSFKENEWKNCQAFKSGDLLHLKCGELQGFLLKGNHVLASGELEVLGEVLIRGRKFYHLLTEGGNSAYYSLIPEIGKSLHTVNNCGRPTSC